MNFWHAKYELTTWTCGQEEHLTGDLNWIKKLANLKCLNLKFDEYDHMIGILRLWQCMI